MNTFSKLAATLAAVFCAQAVLAYPVVDKVVPTGGQPIAVYEDHVRPGHYWYIPQSIEPWSRDNRYRSELVYKQNRYLTFVFRGQASVSEDMLQKVAKANNTTIANFSPIAYDSSSGLTCENVFGEKLTWMFPPKIGNYLEVVPSTLHTTDIDTMEQVAHLVQGNGLACYVGVTFKAVATAYMLKLTADMNQVYERFEAAAHAEGLWWEVDLHTLIQSLHRSGVIKIEKIEDVNAPRTPLDEQVNAAWTEVTKQIIAIMFKPALKLPEGDMVGRGKAWSLRADYRRSTENAHFESTLDARNISTKDSQIGLRIALE